MLQDVSLDLKAILKSPNFSNLLEKDDLKSLGAIVVADFNADLSSRSKWVERYDMALKLALQVAETKTTPWQDAANVKFPLLTIAAMQYHARAYPALINGPTPVSCRTMAPAPAQIQLPPQPDQNNQQQMMAYQKVASQIIAKARQDGQKYHAAQFKAKRISEHMSFQLLEEDEQWEEEMDKLLLVQAIAGCAFKKSFFDPVKGINRSECVNPLDLVVSYYTKHLDTAPRVSHTIRLFANDLKERELRGVFNPVEEDEEAERILPADKLQTPAADERAGVTPNQQDAEKPFELIEQHRWIDLDGDGYAEPYVITVRYDTEQVLRIVARFTYDDISFNDDQQIVRIQPITCFTKYPFIPSPDGGFYDIGFGALLGPINHSIDTAINQLLDAGSLSNSGGGFLGRGFKGRKGSLFFRLGEWKQTDATGDDLRKSIFPLPIREPSGVLFNLLGLLIQYGQQIAGATDTMQGEAPGQNTPAETSRITLEQGMKVFNGIYKRTHRAFTQELRKLFKLNQVFLSDESTYYTAKEEASSKIFQADYSGPANMIRPAASAFYMSDSQRLNQATAVLQVAMAGPGYNQYRVHKQYLEALKVADIDDLLPDPQGPNAIPPAPNPKLQIEQLKAQTKQLEMQVNLRIEQLHIAAEAEKVQAEIQNLKAETMKLLAEAEGVDTGQQIALINAQIGAKKNAQDALVKSLQILQKVMESQKDGNQSGGIAGLASAPGNDQIPGIPTTGAY